MANKENTVLQVTQKVILEPTVDGHFQVFPDGVKVGQTIIGYTATHTEQGEMIAGGGQLVALVVVPFDMFSSERTGTSDKVGKNFKGGNSKLTCRVTVPIIRQDLSVGTDGDGNIITQSISLGGSANIWRETVIQQGMLGGDSLPVV